MPEIWPENWPAWELWNAVNTQWRMGGFGIGGLDYPAVYQTADLLGHEMTPAMLRKIQALEGSELRRFAEKHKKGGGAGE